jgi:sporulation protein YlmC with PRC-barrel domain
MEKKRQNRWGFQSIIINRCWRIWWIREEMTRELTSFLNLPVYTNRGIYVGETKNIIIDTDTAHIHTLLVTGISPQLMDDPQDIGIPFRWISAIGDIILLSHFPTKIITQTQEPDEK